MDTFGEIEDYLYKEQRMAGVYLVFQVILFILCKYNSEDAGSLLLQSLRYSQDIQKIEMSIFHVQLLSVF